MTGRGKGKVIGTLLDFVAVPFVYGANSILSFYRQLIFIITELPLPILTMKIRLP